MTPREKRIQLGDAWEIITKALGPELVPDVYVAWGVITLTIRDMLYGDTDPPPAPAVDAEALIDAVTTYASFAQAFGICSSRKSESSRAYRQARTDRDAARDAAFTAIHAIHAALRPIDGPPEGHGERAVAARLREIIERIDAFGADITGAYPSIHPDETGWSTILAGLITDLEALAAAPPLKRDDAEMAVAVLRRVLGAHGEHMNAAADPDTPPGTVKYLYNRIDDVFMEAWEWIAKYDKAHLRDSRGGR